MMYQQPQMATLQPPVHLPQQQQQQQQQQNDNVISSSLAFTSDGPAISFTNSTPSTSQSSVPIHSVAPQPTTVHTPVTTVQCNSYSQQKSHCDNSINSSSSSSSSSSQVATCDPFVYFDCSQMH